MKVGIEVDGEMYTLSNVESAFDRGDAVEVNFDLPYKGYAEKDIDGARIVNVEREEEEA